MSVIVDSNISRAINQYIEDSKRPAWDFAKKLGVSQATLTKWRKRGNGITPPRWQKLFEHIKKYLPRERIKLDDGGGEFYVSAWNDLGDNISFPIKVPLITIEIAAKYPGVIESFAKFAGETCSEKVEYHPKDGMKDGVFGIRVDSDEWAPSIPKGATVFLLGEREYPIEGDITLVKTRNGDARFARFHDEGGYLRLDDLSSNRKKGALFDKKIAKSESSKKICWIIPALSMEVAFRP